MSVLKQSRRFVMRRVAIPLFIVAILLLCVMISPSRGQSCYGYEGTLLDHLKTLFYWSGGWDKEQYPAYITPYTGGWDVFAIGFTIEYHPTRDDIYWITLYCQYRNRWIAPFPFYDPIIGGDRACFYKDSTTDWPWDDGDYGPYPGDPIIDPPPNFGIPHCEQIGGESINLGTGNKFQQEADFSVKTPGPELAFRRSYNGQSIYSGPLGYGWTHNYNLFVEDEGTRVVVWDGDGKALRFKKEGGGDFTPEPLVYDTLVQEGGGTGDYVLTRKDNTICRFNPQGRLLSIKDLNDNQVALSYDGGLLIKVTNNLGKGITFTHNPNNRIETVGDAAGNTYTFTYTGDNLTGVAGPDGVLTEYLYGDPHDPHNMTQKRVAGETVGIWGYDEHDRATSASKAGGAEVISVNYGDPSAVDGIQALVTDSRGYERTYRFLSLYGIPRVIGIEGAGCSGCGGTSRAYDYDTDSFALARVIDRNGNATDFTRDARGNILTKKEASGTDLERTTTYTYHPTYNLVASITQESVANPGQGKVTTFSYDTEGNLTTRTLSGYVGPIQHQYTTTYDHNSFGQLTMVDGPRTDVSDITTYTYDPATGNLLSMTQPLVGTTSYSNYDQNGNVGTITDSNGVVTSYTYDQRNRVKTITNGADGSTTQYFYDPRGNIDYLVLPEGNAIDYTYDSAGRLTRVEDDLGNAIIYTYDTEGNKIREEIRDPDGALKKYLDFQYNEENRLEKIINPDTTFTQFGYDGNGNRTSMKDPRGKTTTYQYDELNRLEWVTQPGGIRTTYSYDAHDNLDAVEDANYNYTLYTYDDFGRLAEAISPDTRTTTYLYDGAENLIQKADAKGITTAYTYDALNRLTSIGFPDPNQDIAYTYDSPSASNGKGRLTGMADPTGVYTYGYDSRGNLIREEKLIAGITYTTEYGYDRNDTLTSITYPSGRVVAYDLDAVGRVSSVRTTLNGQSKALASNLDHLPYGGITGFMYGNGISRTQGFDLQYRMTSVQSGSAMSRTYGHDANGNIIAISDLLDASRNQGFGYDDINRLTSASGIYGQISYAYDFGGNRASVTRNGQYEYYTYTYGTNRLIRVTGQTIKSFGYDNSGNITSEDARTYTYNQNNRLIRATENGLTLGEYAYNGVGQRIKKVTDGTSTIYHYDRLGNLIAESDGTGKFQVDYIYLGGQPLAKIEIEQVPVNELTITVLASGGRPLENVPVYAFDMEDNYLGISARTNPQGKATFDLDQFAPGQYKFRADYLSYQFWTDPMTLPDVTSYSLTIEERQVKVVVTQAGSPKQGARVYLFNGQGQYLGISATTDQNGEASFELPVGKDFQFRSDLLGNQYFSSTITVHPEDPNDLVIHTGGGTVTLTVDKGEGTPIASVPAYLFSSPGSYLGRYENTDAQGQAGFVLSAGTYKFRVDYRGYQFWSGEIAVTTGGELSLPIPHGDVAITVQGDYGGDIEPRESLPVYLFTSGGQYLGESKTTDAQGRILFNLPERAYKARTDYLSYQFWSDEFTWQNETITIQEGTAEVTVTQGEEVLPDVPVYLFNASMQYLGIYGHTDDQGMAVFRLPNKTFKFRADNLGNQYFSTDTEIIPQGVNPVEVATGGGPFTLRVEKEIGVPLVGVSTYLFTAGGTYLGQSVVTNDQGEAGYSLSDGQYQFRVDYRGYQFWTQTFSVPFYDHLDHLISHQDVAITVQGNYGGNIEPRVDLPVYLFNSGGTYLGESGTTDAQGRVVFNLSERAYKVRTDYLSYQFWSDEFTWQDQAITFGEGMAEVRVTQGGNPLVGVPVYLFNGNDGYLGISQYTDDQGVTTFRLPDRTFKFRADYQGKQYWATQAIVPHVVNTVEIETGGGAFVLTVDRGEGTPMPGIPVYVFTGGGVYLGMSGTTDGQGRVSFDLSDGQYKFRADYLGYQFWSEVYTVPDTLSETLSISHQDVAITVENLYGTQTDPVPNIPGYLFKPPSSYLGKSATTGSNGQVVFSLPERSYKARADYVGYQFWSGEFTWADTSVTIENGIARIHVHRSGSPVVGARVYLFKGSGGYLGYYADTDGEGIAEFDLPDRQYKFRVDWEGAQYWSDPVTIVPHQVNEIDMDLDLLGLNLTRDRLYAHNNPKKIQLAMVGLPYGLLVSSVIAAPGVSESIYYYHNDHLGTPQVLTDDQGQVVWKGDYRPFGGVDVVVEEVKNNFRFPGQYYDQETGLHYNYHRYYQPKIGRYTQPDPIGLILGDLNPFAYALGNPIGKIDPFGLITIDGMECTEKGRRRLPGYSPGIPFDSYVGGERVICTEIVIEDLFSCVCIGKWQRIIVELYKNLVSYEVSYICCPKNQCGENCKDMTRIETEDLGIMQRKRYEWLPERGAVVRHGFTFASMKACSACPGGVGSPM
jgi:RHS repeat-associated protein